MSDWVDLRRPGYFGRNRDHIVAGLDSRYGQGNWRLVWKVQKRTYPWRIEEGPILTYEFTDACRLFYEESYFRCLSKMPTQIDYACSFGECIDNAMTNIQSGLDYTKQESNATHIQDIALRNVLKRIGRWFEGPAGKILIIHSNDSNGYSFGPGNIPFYEGQLITRPSKCPKWASLGSVEDFWQSNKWLQVRAGIDANSDQQLKLLFGNW